MKVSRLICIIGVLVVSILACLFGVSVFTGYGNFTALTTGVVVERDRSQFWRDLLKRFDWNKFDWENFPWERFTDFPWKDLPWDSLPEDFDYSRLPWEEIAEEFVEDFPFDKLPWEDLTEDQIENFPWDEVPFDRFPEDFDWSKFDFDNLPEDFDYSKLPWDKLPADFDYSKLPWDKMTDAELAGLPWDKMTQEQLANFPWDRVPLDKLPEGFDYSKLPWDTLPEDFDYNKLPWDKMTDEELAQFPWERVPFDQLPEDFDYSRIPWDKLPEDFDYSKIPWSEMTGDDLSALPWDKLPMDKIPWGDVPLDKLPEDFDYSRIPWDKLPADFDYGQIPWDKMTDEQLANVPWENVPLDKVPWGDIPLDKLPSDFPWDKLPWGSMDPSVLESVPWDSFTEDDWRNLPPDFPWWAALGALALAGGMPPDALPDGIIPQESIPDYIPKDLIPAEWRSKFESTAPPHDHTYKVIKTTKQRNCGRYGEVIEACTFEGCTYTRTRAVAPTNQHSYDDNLYCPVCGLYRLHAHSDSATLVYDGTPLSSGHATFDAALSSPIIEERGYQVFFDSFRTITNPGTAVNSFAVHVRDASGADVTDLFYMDMAPGTLRVKQRSLHITTLGLTRSQAELNGRPLTGDMAGYDEEDAKRQLAPGHTLEVFFDPEGYTEPGSYENIPIGYKITDAAGNDVTAYYDITDEYGKLRIK